jgi:2-iminobutanoate/2-iminopropanoate deaminase
LLGVAAVGRAGDPTSRRRTVGGSPNPAFSRAVGFGGIVYVAGVIGRKPGTTGAITESFEEQCRHSLDAMKASVEAAGSSLSHVLKCTCFLTDVNDFAAFNKIFMEYFASDPPARSTVVVKALVVPGARIEIDCVTCVD